MKHHIANATWGVLDYATYPLGLLIAAPWVLRSIGVERYGVWMMASALSMTGGVIASGLGDANIRITARLRGQGNAAAVIRSVENALGLHISLGCCVAGVAWLLSSWIARRSAGTLYTEGLWSLRIASAAILLRAVETVCVSTLRGLTLYGVAYRTAGVCRILGLAAALLAAASIHRVTGMMMATLLVSAAGLLLQMRSAAAALCSTRLRPRLEWRSIAPLLRFGSFTWIQAVAALLFAQVDRLAVGILFGATQVTMYAICSQLTQPLYGLTAAGLHFIFPYVASNSSHNNLRSRVVRLIGLNIALSVLGGVLLAAFGPTALSWVAGARATTADASLLNAMACASALAAMSVTGFYAMLALDRPGVVCGLAIAGSVAGAALMPLLTQTYGPTGMAFARSVYAVVGLLVYAPLLGLLARKARCVETVPSWEEA